MHPAFPAEDLDLVLSLTPEFWSRFGGSRLFMTGGTGFIGQWLLQALQRANDHLGSRIEMVVLSRDPARVRAQSPHVFARADTKLVTGDVRDFAAPAGRFDLMVHAAADVGNPGKSGDALRLFDSLVTGTRRALDLADTSGVSRFLFTSSGAVYGTQPPDLERMPEDHPGAPQTTQPGTAYANGKRTAEWLTTACAEHAGFTACLARIYALIGPGMPFDGPFAAGNFMRDALAGDAIRVRGDGRPLRSFMYMADLCIWLLRILGSGQSGQAYNVGSEQALSIADFAHRVSSACGTNPAVCIEAPIGSGAAARYIPDTHKARTGLGLAEYTSLDAALLKTFNWNRVTAA